MNDNVAISVNSVSKNFKLPHERADSIKSLFINPFNKKRKKFEIQHALKNISFDIQKGEFFGIVGRNGSGKSTLLKIIAGIYQPNQGSVKINGRLVPFIELGVGFNPELTGRENVYLNGALMGFSEQEVDNRYRAIVGFAELERFMDQKLKNYSSGMQVRLAFSVATILAESDILLIDEVLAVGDADFQRKCFEYFARLKKNKKTVIFVSHDMNAVREYCDRAVLIDNSEIIFSGTASAVAEEYKKLFLPDVYQQELETENAKNHAKNLTSTTKWGVGSVDINNLKTDKKVYHQKDASIEISFTITPEKGYRDEIIPGVTIKNTKGEPVCGTNTDIIKKKRLETIDKDITMTWSFPNIFNEGDYYIEPAILSGTTKQTLQWWNEALKFTVVNNQSSPYQVSPTIKAVVTKP